MSQSRKTSRPHRRQRPTAAQRRAVEARANGLCEYCHCVRRFVPQPFNVEHIIPVVRGGKTEIKNLAWACAGCNYCKYDKVDGVDPLTGRTVRLFNPRRQRWSNHFGWNENGTLMVGLTSTGRATIKALQLNREELVNLREVLGILKLHPPE